MKVRMPFAPQHGSRSVCVAIMAYNEAPSLERVVGEIYDDLMRLGADWEIVIIDEGSTDGSREIADRLAQGHTGIRANTAGLQTLLERRYHIRGNAAGIRPRIRE